MADTKISALTELAAEPAADDEFVLVDKSDTTMAASGTDKRLRYDRVSGLWVPKALVDAKGDLVVGTADNTVARRAVGTNGQFLTADSAEADGVKWTNAGLDVWRPSELFGGARLPASSALGLRALLLADVSPASAALTTNPVRMAWLDADAYAIAGKTPKLRLVVTLVTNSTSPGTTTLTFGLYPVTTGGAGVGVIYTLGTVVTSSTCAFVNPGASHKSRVVSSEIGFPTDDFYVLGVDISATTAASSYIHGTAHLEVRWV